MLDEREFSLVSACMTQLSDRKKGDRFGAMLAEYNRITGFNETNANAVWHHRISIYGSPCPRCGKVLRTPVTYKCFECGHIVHPPNWSFLFKVGDVFAVQGRGTVLIANRASIAGRLHVGDSIELRVENRVVVQTSVDGLETFFGSPTATSMIGVLVSKDVIHENIRRGQDVWLISASSKS
jgi:hypothetical protein